MHRLIKIGVFKKNYSQCAASTFIISKKIQTARLSSVLTELNKIIIGRQHF